MSKNKIRQQNPEIQVLFIKQEKLKEQIKLQNQLHFEILRVQAAEKQSYIEQVEKMNQNQLCDFFLDYKVSPQAQFSVQQIKQSKSTKLIRNKGKVYFGQVKNKQMSGRGICFYKQGKIYQGSFWLNKKEGIGCQIYSNGNLFMGEFVNNKKHGKGQFFWFTENSSNKISYQYYDGQWWGGLPDGPGINQKANGDHYEGTFKNGLKHGFGQQIYANGDNYKGQFANGLPQGIGTYFWKDGSSYHGDFKQGLRSGFGLWKMGQNENDQKYQGHYCMDKKSGYGQYTWSNGWIYKGNFQNDHRQGYGELFDLNQCVFEGQWSKGNKVIQPTNNFVKISRIIQRNRVRFQEKQQIQIQDVSQNINKTLQPKLERYGEHQLLARPGFLIRRSTKGSLNLDTYRSCQKGQKKKKLDSQALITSRIGTSINRPYSKNSLQSAKTLKQSR